MGTFDTQDFYHSVSWVLERTSDSEDDNQRSMFQATAYGSTLNCGWIPENPAEVFGLLLRDLEWRWQSLYNKATTFLDQRVRAVVTPIFRSCVWLT